MAAPSSRPNATDSIAAVDEVTLFDTDGGEMAVGGGWGNKSVRDIVLDDHVLPTCGIRQTTWLVSNGDHAAACASQDRIAAISPHVDSAMRPLTRFSFAVTEIAKTRDDACAWCAGGEE